VQKLSLGAVLRDFQCAAAVAAKLYGLDPEQARRKVKLRTYGPPPTKWTSHTAEGAKKV